MKYEIKEITPKVYKCSAWACPAIYEGVKEITPKEMGCAACACPSIYEGLKKLTPKKTECTSLACPSINEAEREGQKVYLIVGKIVNTADAGLEEKVGKGEAIIEVPRGLINGIIK